MTTTPRQAAQRVLDEPRLPAGDGDRMHGYGVMGVPFESGDYLALRHWPVTSFGPGYRAVWHRDPRGAWTLYADQPPDVTCARFASAAADRTVTADIVLTWTDDRRLVIAVGDIHTVLEIRDTWSSTALTRIGGNLPERAWRSDTILRATGGVAGPALHAGRLHMVGRTPNRQRYRVAARRVWVVGDTAGHVGGRILGPQCRPSHQVRLGPMLLPQRGLFFADASARFTAKCTTDGRPPARSHLSSATTGGTR